MVFVIHHKQVSLFLNVPVGAPNFKFKCLGFDSRRSQMYICYGGLKKNIPVCDES